MHQPDDGKTAQGNRDRCVQRGRSASIQNLLNVAGMTILNNFASPFGPDAVRAFGIAQKISMIPMYIAMGVSQGLQPLVGYNYSSGNYRRMKDAILFALKVSLILWSSSRPDI